MAQTLASFESRNALGAYGELYATRLLAKLASIRKASVNHKRYAGDIRAIATSGTILRIEVKTATLATDKRFHFTLKKHGHTDCKNTDFVVLLCVMDIDLVIPFIIPTDDIRGLRAIAITRNVVEYAGKYAKYRNAFNLID